MYISKCHEEAHGEQTCGNRMMDGAKPSTLVPSSDPSFHATYVIWAAAPPAPLSRLSTHHIAAEDSNRALGESMEHEREDTLTRSYSHVKSVLDDWE